MSDLTTRLVCQWVKPSGKVYDEASVEPDLDAMVDVLNGLTAEDLPHVTWHRGAAKALLRAAFGEAVDG